MTGRRQEIVLGAIVFTAAVIAVLGAVWLSENYAGPAGGYKLKVRFDSVVGLNRGNPVALRGVQVGKVLGIEIDEEGYPLVEIGFRHLRDLPVDTRILLKSLGMLGEQMIEVQIGSAEQTLPDGARIRGRPSPGLAQLTVDAARMASDVRAAVDTLLTPRNVAHLRNTVTRLDSAVTAIHRTVEDNQSVVGRTLAQLADATEGAGRMVAETRPGVRASVENLQSAAARLERLSAELETSSETLKSLLANLDRLSDGLVSGKGTLGKLLVDDSLYVGLRRTVASVDSLVTDVRLHPERYFKVSVF